MEARMTHAWRRGSTALPVRAAPAASPGAPTAGPDALNETELALVRRVCSGDEAAFEQIFRGYYAPLVSFACRNVGSQALAEELVQEVFLHIWMRREQWVVERSLAAYLFRCVRNRILNARRSLRLETAYAADAALHPRVRRRQDASAVNKSQPS